jgi:hypothetical protein
VEEGEAVQVGTEDVQAVGGVADEGQERGGERGRVGRGPAGDELEGSGEFDGVGGVDAGLGHDRAGLVLPGGAGGGEAVGVGQNRGAVTPDEQARSHHHTNKTIRGHPASAGTFLIPQVAGNGLQRVLRDSAASCVLAHSTVRHSASATVRAPSTVIRAGAGITVVSGKGGRGCGGNPETGRLGALRGVAGFPPRF